MKPTPGEPVSLKSASPLSLSREDEAQRDLGGSVFRTRARGVVILGFVGMLVLGVCSVWFGRIPGAATEQAASVESSATASVASSSQPAPGPPEGFENGAFLKPLSWLWNRLPSPASTRAFEKHLEESSGLVAWMRPWVQTCLVRLFREGNTQVVVAPDGWLFFQKDLDYVNGAPFLAPRRQLARAERERVAADPLPAVLDFQGQLAARGIRLVLVPVPVKPCIEGHRLGTDPGAPGAKRLRQNVSFAPFVARLRAEGVEVFDPAPLLFERLQRTSEAQYLARDTHWTPQAMGAVAHALAREVERVNERANERGGEQVSRPAAKSVVPALGEVEAVASGGDTLALLGLPGNQAVFPLETVQIQPVVAGGMLWKADPRADVLLLGDSFSNIYSMNEMGWGARAGFAEHLSAALGRPVDALLRNSDGAFATRQMLQRELAKGRDRLAGKKVVVWEFAVRELAFGDWKSVSLAAGTARASGFFSPPVGGRVKVEGTVARISSVPRPGSVPYREHIMSVLLEDVVVAGAAEEGRRCLVYTWSMRGQRLAGAASLRPGDRVTWELAAWEEVQAEREKFQRSEFDEAEYLTEPYAWWE